MNGTGVRLESDAASHHAHNDVVTFYFGNPSRKLVELANNVVCGCEIVTGEHLEDKLDELEILMQAIHQRHFLI